MPLNKTGIVEISYDFHILILFSDTSLNVKGVKWLLFKRVKSVSLTEWKSLSKQVKIILKWKSLKKEWKSLQKSEFYFFWELREGQRPLWVPLKSEIHSFEVIFTLFERFLHFSLFERVTISLFYNKRIPRPVPLHIHQINS